MKHHYNQYSFLIIFIFFLASLSFAQQKYFPPINKHHLQPAKVLSNPAQSVMDINNITGWIGNDGYHDWLVGASWNGAYPNGVFVGSIFTEGII